jgi:hypothetical protein
VTKKLDRKNGTLTAYAYACGYVNQHINERGFVRMGRYPASRVYYVGVTLYPLTLGAPNLDTTHGTISDAFRQYRKMLKAITNN